MQIIYKKAKWEYIHVERILKKTGHVLTTRCGKDEANSHFSPRDENNYQSTTLLWQPHWGPHYVWNVVRYFYQLEQQSNKEFPMQGQTGTVSCWERPRGPWLAPQVPQFSYSLLHHQTRWANRWAPHVSPGIKLNQKERHLGGSRACARGHLSHVLYARAQREKLLPPTVCPATCTRLQSWGTKLSPLLCFLLL